MPTPPPPLVFYTKLSFGCCFQFWPTSFLSSIFSLYVWFSILSCSKSIKCSPSASSSCKTQNNDEHHITNVIYMTSFLLFFFSSSSSSFKWQNATNLCGETLMQYGVLKQLPDKTKHQEHTMWRVKEVLREKNEWKKKNPLQKQIKKGAVSFNAKTWSRKLVQQYFTQLTVHFKKIFLSVTCIFVLNAFLSFSSPRSLPTSHFISFP